MSCRSLLFVLFLASTGPAHAEDAPAASQPETRMALTGDFVELGTGHPGISRSHAAVEIVNRSPHPIDVKLGYGSGRVDPGKTLFVRIEPGEQPLEVTSPGAPGDRLEGHLTMEKGRAYALGVAWERVLIGEPPARGMAPPAGTAGAASAAKPAKAAAPAATAQTKPSSGKKGASWKKKTKSGKVDIGRKRKRDR